MVASTRARATTSPYIVISFMPTTNTHAHCTWIPPSPDLVPAAVLKELQKLCDSVKPVPDEIALQLLRDELNCDDLTTLFDDLHLVASASLVRIFLPRTFCRSAKDCLYSRQPLNRVKFIRPNWRNPARTLQSRSNEATCSKNSVWIYFYCS